MHPVSNEEDSGTKNSNSTLLLQDDTNDNDYNNSNNQNDLLLQGETSNSEEISQQSKNTLLSTISALAGNIIEWYDFTVFGYFSDTISDVMFPPQSDNAALVESFVVFGCAFLVRPMGGILFGYIGDTYGAKRALELALFLMAVPTFLMGCLPTYDHIGYGAIVLLTLLRILQGLSVGGQLMSSAVFTLQQHPEIHWGYYSAIVSLSINIGSLIGSLVAVLIRAATTEDQMETWGWRIPFLMGVFLVIPGYYLKYHEQEQESKHAAATNNENDYLLPFKDAIKKENRHAMACLVLISLLSSVTFYLSFTWFPIYMDELVDPPVDYAFLINTIALSLSVFVFTVPPGSLSDKYGRRFIMTIGALGVSIMGPLTVIIAGSTSDTAGTFFCQMFLGLIASFYSSPSVAWMVETFDRRNKKSMLTSISIGQSIATIGGGFSPAVATLMVDITGLVSPAILYPIVALGALYGLYYFPYEDKAQDNVSDENDGAYLPPITESLLAENTQNEKNTNEKNTLPEPC